MYILLLLVSIQGAKFMIVNTCYNKETSHLDIILLYLWNQTE